MIMMTMMIVMMVMMMMMMMMVMIMMVDHLTRAKSTMSPMRIALTPSKEFMIIVPEFLIECKSIKRGITMTGLTQSRRS